LRFRTIERFGRIVVALISAAALVAAAAAALIAAAAAVLFAGIVPIIILLTFAVVEANGLLTDGDAFLVGACVEGGTDHDDRSCKQQSRQLEEM